MSVTYIDPPGPLANTSEPIDFTTTELVTSISIEFNPSIGTGARETVFDGTDDDDNSGGDFSNLYRASTRTGNGPYTWRIVRAGRWPADFRIRIKEAVGGEAIAPAEVPIDGQVAAYHLRGGSMGVDRSGNARHLTVENEQYNAPDLLYSFSTLHRGWVYGDIAALRLTGDFTIVCRAWQRWANVDPQCLFECSGTGSGSAAQNTLYKVWVGFPGTTAIHFYSENGTESGTDTNTGLTFTTARLQPWVWFTIRRQGNTIRVGRDKTFNNFTHAAATGGGSARFSVGKNVGGGEVWQGGISDLNVWDSYLTDDELNDMFDLVIPAGLVP